MTIYSESLKVKAAAELELRRRRGNKTESNPLEQYRFEPVRYIREKLGWEPWAGDAEHPGQVEVIAAYELALRQLHERDDYEQGEIAEDDLQYWQPGQVIQNRIRVEAGHTVGKTKLASGIFSHFFDTCTPSIIYSFAPTAYQINNLLWKEIRADRRKNNLPGRVLKTPRLDFGDDNPDHFAEGRATQNSDTESVQGQHGKYLMFIVDEAEGVADFVYDAIESMTSGGIAIVFMLANPRTRTSQFHKQRVYSDVANFRISCIYHPNVLADKEIVPGAVRRQYVETMLEKHCEIVDRHEPDNHTFTLPWRDGVYRPDAEFLFRVLGIAPSNLSDNTFVTVGRYEAACKTQSQNVGDDTLRIGVDVARYGTDSGTIYVRWKDVIWRHCSIQGQNTNRYRDEIRKVCTAHKAKGAKRLHLRVDGGGGYASGIIDPLRIDIDFNAMFDEVVIVEVHNNGTPYDVKSYADLGTEIYAEAAETLKGCVIRNAPSLLESDLTERTYTFVNKSGRTVKKLTEKEKFKDANGRSPDDGDGFCLCAAPDVIFRYMSPAGLVDFA